MTAIVINNYSKQYGEIHAVREINLEISGGELFGLIGPDGSGKTTLMRTLATLLMPSTGSLLIGEMDTAKEPAAIRAILGYMPQRFSLYQDLTVAQNLNFFADLFQVEDKERSKRMEQLYQFSRLLPFRDRRAGALSGGMKQKLALSCALIHTPRVLLLDEPTFGVDPVSRQEFWEILHEINKQGTTILVSTAYMDEADQCDRVALMFEGQIKGLDTPANLHAKYQYPLFLIETSELRTLDRYLREHPQVHDSQMFGDALHVSFSEDPDETFWRETDQNIPGGIRRRQKIDPSIEDIFLSLMGGKP